MSMREFGRSLTDVPGFRVGHATDATHQTGCTVVLCPPNTVGSAEVRGLAPGTREMALLSPEKSMQEVHAVLLTGGSAFGLAAADGVVRYLEEQGIGYPTPMARVPIVPAAVVYDLFASGGARRPDAAMGYAACVAAQADNVPQGRVGAGTGVSVGKWAGFEAMMPGGFGMASMRLGEGVVGAAAVVNPVGDVVDADGRILAGARTPDGGWLGEEDPLRQFRVPPLPGTNTTLVVVATNAALDKVACYRLAQRAHDGMALAIRYAHGLHDGDTAFVLASGTATVDFNTLGNAVVEVVAEAIRSAVR
nr:P1 family peptidase [Ardenticatena sp.]